MNQTQECNSVTEEGYFDSLHRETNVFSPEDMEACFSAFDKDGDGNLDLTEFEALCRALFRNDRGRIYSLESNQLQDMFNVFDKNRDGFIDGEEFIFCWNYWVKRIVRPVSALIVVDVQNDFISGSLDISRCSAKHNGEEVIEPINRLLTNTDFDAVIYSLDWHPVDHVSFLDNVPLRKIHSSSHVTAEEAKTFDTVVFEGPPLTMQKLWPRHCVQETWGAELHKDLKVADNAIFIRKGTNSAVDSYSVFWDNNKLSQTTLDDLLQEKKVTDLFLCGVAYDVCVGYTAIDALEMGYRTVVIDDACRGVSVEDIENTKAKIVGSYGVIVKSNQVRAMVEGRDRRPELGYKLALELQKRPAK